MDSIQKESEARQLSDSIENMSALGKEFDLSNSAQTIEDSQQFTHICVQCGDTVKPFMFFGKHPLCEDCLKLLCLVEGHLRRWALERGFNGVWY